MIILLVVHCQDIRMINANNKNWLESKTPFTLVLRSLRKLQTIMTRSVIQWCVWWNDKTRARKHRINLNGLNLYGAIHPLVPFPCVKWEL